MTRSKNRGIIQVDREFPTKQPSHESNTDSADYNGIASTLPCRHSVLNLEVLTCIIRTPSELTLAGKEKHGPKAVLTTKRGLRCKSTPEKSLLQERGSRYSPPELIMHGCTQKKVAHSSP